METTHKETYFLDTYALLEIVKENTDYKKFHHTLNFTSIMNLLEFHYIISKDFGIKRATEITNKFKKIALNIDIKNVLEASEFRIKNTKNKFSYIDCLGYALACDRNMIFVTGDKEFEHFANVEFIK